MSSALILSPVPALIPAPLYAPTPKAAKRVLEFFTAQVNNDHTRKAYLNATRRFAAWCEERGLHDLAAVQPFHVAAFVKELEGQFSPPTVKQHLAALRMLFDWLVTGHVMETNPAHSVRGPKYVVKCSATIWMRNVLPHPGMFPSGSGIASSGCSRRGVALSIGLRPKPAFLFDR